MPIMEELLERRIVRSKRELSRLLGKPENYVCETRGYFVPYDLIEIRLHLIRIGGHDDLVQRLEKKILSSWRDAA
jgi:hypothetical protein